MLKKADIGVGLYLLAAVVFFIVPIPSVLLDVMLAFNISIALIIVFNVLFVREVLDMSFFPTLLLFTTIFRISLNVSSTRLILLTGDPGNVVKTFGSFVGGGNMVVGSIVFIVLVLIQFIVINKVGCTAGLIITFINLIGGTIMGVMNQGLGFADAIQQYGLLTIGDGLVSQIPSLLISLATGILVTKGSNEADFSGILVKQLFGIPRVLLYCRFRAGFPRNFYSVKSGFIYCTWSGVYHRRQKISARISAKKILRKKYSRRRRRRKRSGNRRMWFPCFRSIRSNSNSDMVLFRWQM